MITRRDIIKSGASALKSNERHTKPKKARKLKVMKTPAYTLSENDSIQSAIDVILRYDIGRVTIVNEEGRVSGIVDRQDLLEAIANAWPEKLLDDRF